MKKQKYGEAAKRHAINLRKISGFSYPEIEAATGIPAAYVRKMICEENAKEVTLTVTGNGIEVTDAPNVVTQSVTAVTNEIMPEKQAENPVFVGEMDKKSVTNFARFFRHFSLMHLVFYTTTVTACYAVWDALPNVIGAALLTVYGLFSLDSLLKAQDGTRPNLAEYGRNRVIASELIAAVFHAVILNKYLWINRAALPFEIKLLPPKGGNFEIDFRGNVLNGVWQNGEVIFYISAVISALLFVAAFAAVDAVLRENKTSATNGNP